jgi:Domain of unknown function (DUF4190)
VTATGPYPQRTDGGAIASLVLGILGFVVFPVVPSVLAIWLGVSAKRRMRDDPTLGGEGLATAGVILGVTEIVLVALAVGLLLALAASFDILRPAVVLP